MKLKKLTALLLAAALTLSLGACAPKEAKWIATNNGKDVPSGIYLTYMLNAYSEASGKVADKEADVLKQEVDGVPAADWITNKADEAFRTYIAVENKAEEESITPSVEELAYLNQQLQSQWQYMGGLYEQNGISYESYSAVSLNAYKQNRLFTAQYGAGGKTPIAEEELLKAFQEGYYKTMYVTMSLTDTEGNDLDEAGKQKVMDKAAEVLAKATAEGANYSEVILAYEKEQAVKKGDEESSVHEHDESSHISFIAKDTTGYSEEFLKALGEMKAGETRTVTSNTLVYVLQKLENNTPADLETYRSQVMKTLKGDEFDGLVKSWAEATTVEYKAASKSFYTPSKLKMK